MSTSPDVILEAVLNSYQLRVEIIVNARYCGDWYDEEPATGHGQFHLIGDGECWISASVLGAPIRVTKGDLVVFPTGARHVLSSTADCKPVGASRESTTSMLCGELEFILGARNPVLDALPKCFVVRSGDGGEAFRHLASILIGLANEPCVGQRVMQNKLADCLFTMAVCRYASQSGEARGIFAALSDSRLARVLAAIHANAGKDWTLQSLAEMATMSRSAFAAHFSEVVGIPPIQYLSHWRIVEARRLLGNRQLSVAHIAERLGYSTEAAFRKMFKRLEGVGPGEVRSNKGVSQE